MIWYGPNWYQLFLWYIIDTHSRSLNQIMYLMAFREFFMNFHFFTHRGRVTHICVDTLTTIASDNGLPPSQHQAIIWTNVHWTLRNKLQSKSIEIYTFSFKKMYLKMSPGKWRSIWFGLNVLTQHPCWVPDPPMKWVGTQFTNLRVQDLPAKYRQITWGWLILAAKIKIRRYNFDAMAFSLLHKYENVYSVKGYLKKWLLRLLTSDINMIVSSK